MISQPSQKLICHSQVALLLKLVWCSSSKELLCGAGYTGVTAVWSRAHLRALETMTLCVYPGEQRRNGCCINMLRMWGPQIKLVLKNIEEALEAKFVCVCVHVYDFRFGFDFECVNISEEAKELCLYLSAFLENYFIFLFYEVLWF